MPVAPTKEPFPKTHPFLSNEAQRCRCAENLIRIDLVTTGLAAAGRGRGWNMN
jgi:hypothetical protein